MDVAALQEMRALEDRHFWFRGKRCVLGPDVAAALRRAPEGPLLDLGCGTGGNLAWLGRGLAAGRRRIGLDAEPAALSLASRRDLPDTALVRGTGARLPFEEGSIACAIGLDILEHCEDDRRVLAELRRVLRPGGQLVLSVPAYPSLWSPHDEALHHLRRYRAGQLEALLAEAGFRLRARHGFNFLLLPAVYVARAFRRGRSGRREEATTDFFELPQPINALCFAPFLLERAILRLWSVPFGVSFVACAERPPA